MPKDDRDPFNFTIAVLEQQDFKVIIELIQDEIGRIGSWSQRALSLSRLEGELSKTYRKVWGEL